MSPDSHRSPIPTPDHEDEVTLEPEQKTYTNSQFWNYVDDQLLKLYKSAETDCHMDKGKKEFISEKVCPHASFICTEAKLGTSMLMLQMTSPSFQATKQESQTLIAWWIGRNTYMKALIPIW